MKITFFQAVKLVVPLKVTTFPRKKKTSVGGSHADSHASASRTRVETLGETSRAKESRQEFRIELYSLYYIHTSCNLINNLFFQCTVSECSKYFPLSFQSREVLFFPGSFRCLSHPMAN